MQTRLATADDLPQIADLFLSCVQVSYAGVLSEDVRRSVDEEFSLGLWTNALGSNPERQTFLAFEGSLLAGFYRIGPEIENPSIGHLFSLYVSPKLAGRGLGRQLLSRAIESLEASGFKDISLWVFADNQVASSLYQKFGFETTELNRTSEDWRALEVKMIRRDKSS